MVVANSDHAPRPADRDRLRSVVGGVLTTAVVVGLILALIRDRREFVDSLELLGPTSAVLSLTMGIVGVTAGWPLWRAMLGGHGAVWPYRASARVFFVSQLGKYLPGSAWPIVMQMEVARKVGTKRRVIVVSNVLTLAVTCLVGLVLGIVLLALADETLLHEFWWVALAVPLLVALLYPPVLSRALSVVARLLRRSLQLDAVSTATVVKSAAWAVVAWVFLSLHIAILAAAVGYSDTQTLLLSAGAIALAVPAGVLFIPAPAGGGVRELVIVLVLSGSMSSGQALAVAVASRVLLVIADAILAAASWVVCRDPRDSF